MFHTLALFCFLAPSNLENARPTTSSSLQECGIEPLLSTDFRQRLVLKLFASSRGIAPQDNGEDAARPPVPPPKRWRSPFFEDIVDTIESHVTKDRSSMDPGQNATVYTLQEGFLPEDRFWIDYVRVERMIFKSNILFRPEIVHDLAQQIDAVLASNVARGLMVKGPQGVGKSYSLINLSRFLLASGKYWVTIIPNCEDWITESDFLMFLLQSVGVDPDLFRHKYKPSGRDDFKDLISDIDIVLSEHGIKWVFIFDQINRIFARREFQTQKDIGVLPFPFVLMKQVCKPGRIISIISASANNDVAYKDNHEGFDVYDHPTQLDDNEISLLYPRKQIAQWDWDKLGNATGRVPLYLNRWAQDPDDYSSEVRSEIKRSLRKLQNEQTEELWEDYVESSIQYLLQLSLPNEPVYFDRKFLQVQKSVDKPYKYNIVALFPLVLQEYYDFFRDNLFKNIMKNERNILIVCNDPATTADVRGRLFERLAIARIVEKASSRHDLKRILTSANVTLDNVFDADLEGPAQRIYLRDQKYPEGAFWNNDLTYFIPDVLNYPAVDLIISVRKIAIAIQIHVSDHQNVLEGLLNNAKEAGWKEQVEKIILVYLSPNKEVTQKMKKKIERAIARGGANSADDWVITRFYTIRDFACLSDLQWQVSVARIVVQNEQIIY